MIINAGLQPSIRSANCPSAVAKCWARKSTAGIYDRKSSPRPRLKLGSDTKRIDETSLGIVNHVALALETLLNNIEFDKVARWVKEALGL